MEGKDAIDTMCDQLVNCFVALRVLAQELAKRNVCPLQVYPCGKDCTKCLMDYAMSTAGSIRQVLLAYDKAKR